MTVWYQNKKSSDLSPHQTQENNITLVCKLWHLLDWKSLGTIRLNTRVLFKPLRLLAIGSYLLSTSCSSSYIIQGLHFAGLASSVSLSPILQSFLNSYTCTLHRFSATNSKNRSTGLGYPPLSQLSVNFSTNHFSSVSPSEFHSQSKPHFSNYVLLVPIQTISAGRSSIMTYTIALCSLLIIYHPNSYNNRNAVQNFFLNVDRILQICLHFYYNLFNLYSTNRGWNFVQDCVCVLGYRNQIRRTLKTRP